nr:serine hydrolase [Oculatella sp. LEGE 06141]
MEQSNQPGVPRRRRLTRRQANARTQPSVPLQQRTARYRSDASGADYGNQPIRQSSLIAQPSIRRTANDAAAANVRFNLRHLLFGETPRPAVTLPTKRDGSPRLPEVRTPTATTAKASNSLSRNAARQSSGMTRPSARQRATSLSQPLQRPEARSLLRRRRADDVIQLVPKAVERSRTAKPQLAVASSRRTRPNQRRSRRSSSVLVYATRLLILGVGIGAIAGTFLSVWNPAVRYPAGASEMGLNAASANPPGQPHSALSRDATPSNAASALSMLKPGSEMTALATQIKALNSDLPELTAGVFLMDLDTGNYLNVNGTTVFAAASMIKVPVLVAFLQDVDAGKVRLDERLPMQAADVADGSGDMQYQDVGTEFTALETATKMITISDNTATNMLIRRLGGIEVLNQRFQQWGLTQTTLHNILPDLEGTNVTTPKELTDLLLMVTQGDLLSIRSRDRLLDIMRQTVTDTLLPAGLDESAVIAHKTGDIGSMVGDTGIVDVPNGKRYVVTVMMKRPHNDDRAQDLIRNIARMTYQQISMPPAANTVPVSPGSATPAQASPASASPGESPATGLD